MLVHMWWRFSKEKQGMYHQEAKPGSKMFPYFQFWWCLELNKIKKHKPPRRPVLVTMQPQRTRQDSWSRNGNARWKPVQVVIIPFFMVGLFWLSFWIFIVVQVITIPFLCNYPILSDNHGKRYLSVSVADVYFYMFFFYNFWHLCFKKFSFSSSI